MVWPGLIGGAQYNTEEDSMTAYPSSDSDSSQPPNEAELEGIARLLDSQIHLVKHPAISLALTDSP